MESFSVTALLAFPIPGKPIVLTTDASDVAVGAVLKQVVQGQPGPLAFLNRKLLKAERMYSTFDHELLAVHQGVCHFRHFLEGSTFTIQTDIPLVHAFTKQADAWSPCQHHLSVITKFNCSFRHLPGKRNPVADTISKVPSTQYK